MKFVCWEQGFSEDDGGQTVQAHSHQSAAEKFHENADYNRGEASQTRFVFVREVRANGTMSAPQIFQTSMVMEPSYHSCPAFARKCNKCRCVFLSENKANHCEDCASHLRYERYKAIRDLECSFVGLTLQAAREKAQGLGLSVLLGEEVGQEPFVRLTGAVPGSYPDTCIVQRACIQDRRLWLSEVK